MIVLTTVGPSAGLLTLGTFLFAAWPLLWEHLDRKGRVPAHSLLDFCIAYLVLALLLTLLLGSVGSGGDFSAAIQVARPCGLGLESPERIIKLKPRVEPDHSVLWRQDRRLKIYILS